MTKVPVCLASSSILEFIIHANSISEGAGDIHSSDTRSCSQDNHSLDTPQSWPGFMEERRAYVYEIPYGVC